MATDSYLFNYSLISAVVVVAVMGDCHPSVMDELGPGEL